MSERDLLEEILKTLKRMESRMWGDYSEAQSAIQAEDKTQGG